MVAPLLDYQLSDEDNTKINAAFKALSGSDLAKAKDLQAGLSDPLARKLVEWERLRGGEGQAAEYLKFLSENPDWPSREQLQRRMEETLFEEAATPTSSPPTSRAVKRAAPPAWPCSPPYIWRTARRTKRRRWP